MDNKATNNAESKYKKLIENIKDTKKNNKILKCLATASLIDIVPIHKWWDEEVDGEENEIRWTSLEHNGVVFAPRYEPHGIPIKYKGEDFYLTPIQEEIATFWAQLLDNDLSKKDITRRNFTKEFRQVLNRNDVNLEDFDFTPIYEHLQKNKEKNKLKTADEKKIEKDKKRDIMTKYGYALVDGRAEKIANYMVEPPSIFRGRGEHPLSGIIKTRILPEHVTLNIGPDDAVPKCSLPGHSWKDVVQNQEATWLAYYRDNNKDKSSKYIFLAPNSKFKGMNDFKKYEKARKLKSMIEHIRNDYTKKLDEKDVENQQLGVATYLIDKLALRVGNEKGDDEADTVGCCSLRVEHIKLDEDDHIVLDFLGKDSMRYYNKVRVDSKVYNNLAKFIRGKSKEDGLFEMINASKLNDYLKSLVPGLSAKVFRTYNASFTLQQELNKGTTFKEEIDHKIGFYNDANKEVAILCNHQKTVSKNFNVQSEKFQQEVIIYIILA
jgi:DNA topoisomerase-1